MSKYIEGGVNHSNYKSQNQVSDIEQQLNLAEKTALAKLDTPNHRNLVKRS